MRDADQDLGMTPQGRLPHGWLRSIIGRRAKRQAGEREGNVEDMGNAPKSR
jgi:hypothetical protein